MTTFEDGGRKSTDKQYAYQYYLNKGLTPIMASAIVGNLVKESGLKTGIVGTADNKGSVGIAQWHSDRLNNLKKFAGSNWKNLDNQLDFVLHELNTTEQKAFRELKKARTVEEATTAFMNHYERPSSDPRINRVNDRISEALDISGQAPNPNFGSIDYSLNMSSNPINLETSTAEYEEPEVIEAKQDIAQKSFQEDLNKLIQVQQSQEPTQVIQQQEQDFIPSDLPDPYNYIQQDPGYNFEEFQEGGVKKSNDFLQNWYQNRVINDLVYNTQYQKEKPLYVAQSQIKSPIEYTNKVDEFGSQGEYSKDTGVITLLNNSDDATYAHEKSHAINIPLQNTQTSLNAFTEVGKNVIPVDKIQDEWVRKNYNQISNYNEVIPRLNSYRQKYNLKPDQVITPELIKQNREYYKNNPSSFETNTDQLYKMFEDEGLSNVLNKVVSNENLNANYYAQDGGEIIKDNNGYWNSDNWGKVVEINSPHITMRGVNQELIGISKETGERKLMLPGQDYFFEDTKNVIELPVNKSRFR